MLTSSFLSAIPHPLACSTAASAKTNTVRTLIRVDAQHFHYHTDTDSVNFDFLISLSILLSLRCALFSVKSMLNGSNTPYQVA